MIYLRENKKLHIFLFKITSAVLLFYLIFHFIDLSEIVKNIKHINLFLLIVPVVIFFLSIFLSVLKWKKILIFFGINESIKNLWDNYLIGSFYNNFLPSSIGGDGYKFLILSKKFCNKSHIASSIILERGFGYVSIIVLYLIVSIIFFNQTMQNNILSIIFYGVIVIVILLITAFYINLNHKHFDLFRKLRIVDKLFNFFDIIKSVVKSKEIIIYAFVNSLIYNIISSFSLWVIFISIGYNINFDIVLFVSLIVRASAILPLSFNNLGATEGLYVFLFSLFGIATSASLLVVLIGRIISIICSALGGALLLIKK